MAYTLEPSIMLQEVKGAYISSIAVVVWPKTAVACRDSQQRSLYLRVSIGNSNGQERTHENAEYTVYLARCSALPSIRMFGRRPMELEQDRDDVITGAIGPDSRIICVATTPTDNRDRDAFTLCKGTLESLRPALHARTARRMHLRW